MFYFSVSGSCQFNVVIRTACFSPTELIDVMNASVGAGGVMVSVSDVDNEFEEMLLKSKSVMKSIRDAYKIENK